MRSGVDCVALRPYKSTSQLNRFYEVLAVDNFQLKLGALLGVVANTRGTETNIIDALNPPFVQGHRMCRLAAQCEHGPGIGGRQRFPAKTLGCGRNHADLF